MAFIKKTNKQTKNSGLFSSWMESFCFLQFTSYVSYFLILSAHSNISQIHKQHLLDTADHQLKMLVALFCCFHSLLFLLFQKANNLESKYASSLEPKDLHIFFLLQTLCLISKSLPALNVTHFHYGISPPVNYLIKEDLQNNIPFSSKKKIRPI